MTTTTLHELRCAWQAAKALEAKAAQERREIEDAILALLPSKAEGTVTDKDSGIENDANTWAVDTMNNPRYPLELFCRVVTVSLETMKIVGSLPVLDI